MAMLFFLEQLYENLSAYSRKVAFHINGVDFTYSQLSERIGIIQNQLERFPKVQYFGVMTYNHFDTYAAIFALWLSGKSSVPLGPRNPVARNQSIIDQVGIEVIVDVSDHPMVLNGKTTLSALDFISEPSVPFYRPVPPETDLYLLFTSGSTGIPKGVRISRGNFNAYLSSFFNCGYQIGSTDRCLQPFELTFDASAQCYTFPLLRGASVFTVPDKGPKFLSIFKILKEHKITFAKMTPSVIFYLQPYFNQISLPELRYSLFGAEALPESLVQQWEKCVPNAQIHNVYGPTELTINCAFYQWERSGRNKSYNGVVSIGKPYYGMKALVLDEEGESVSVGVTGELCFSGPQTSKGYWKNEENNKKAFFIKTIEGESMRFYRTGDLARVDAEGDLFYAGRVDSQVQIDGFRIELGEIESAQRASVGA